MLEAFGLSDQGCVRQNNEDAFHVDRELGVYVVADGMGGAQAGERASRVAVDAVVEHFGSASHRDLASLAKAFEEANRRVRETASSDASLEGMGTTLVAAVECGDELLISSVGDSRVYLHDGAELLTITEDQTWVNEVGRRLGIGDDALRLHPMRHVLTMAIGLTPQIRIHSYSLRPRPGTQVLLCSDGLHGVIPQDAIAASLGGDGPLDDKCHNLVDAAIRAGAPDNVTVILLRANP